MGFPKPVSATKKALSQLWQGMQSWKDNTRHSFLLKNNVKNTYFGIWFFCTGCRYFCKQPYNRSTEILPSISCLWNIRVKSIIYKANMINYHKFRRCPIARIQRLFFGIAPHDRLSSTLLSRYALMKGISIHRETCLAKKIITWLRLKARRTIQ